VRRAGTSRCVSERVDAGSPGQAKKRLPSDGTRSLVDRVRVQATQVLHRSRCLLGGDGWGADVRRFLLEFQYLVVQTLSSARRRRHLDDATTVKLQAGRALSRGSAALFYGVDKVRRFSVASVSCTQGRADVLAEPGGLGAPGRHRHAFDAVGGLRALDERRLMTRGAPWGGLPGVEALPASPWKPSSYLGHQ